MVCQISVSTSVHKIISSFCTVAETSPLEFSLTELSPMYTYPFANLKVVVGVDGGKRRDNNSYFQDTPLAMRIETYYMIVYLLKN